MHKSENSEKEKGPGEETMEGTRLKRELALFWGFVFTVLSGQSDTHQQYICCFLEEVTILVNVLWQAPFNKKCDSLNYTRFNG